VKNNQFSRSDKGAQAAWKGFSSQTLYIASRIVSDTDNCDFFPEDIEDLVVKKDGEVIEAVQVKNVSSNLTLSSLASTKSSMDGEGFFNRVCSLYATNPLFSKVRIVYFNDLGDELKGFINGDVGCKESLLTKLTENHGLDMESAVWLLSSLIFEKVSIEQLQTKISEQIKEFISVMAAPDLAQSLMVQYVSDLSNSKGSTSLELWKQQMYQIGTDIATMDGYYKEYQKSLFRLCDISMNKDYKTLKDEFKQGVSVHPSHIRYDLDFNRSHWLEKIDESISGHKATIVKGVSGQGKSALCYRYLIDYYPEQFVFCVRSASSIGQVENLAVALKGIAKHTKNMIVYVDVNSGEQHWIVLIQELQARGISVPVLVSIREEDFKMTRINGSSVNIELIELNLSKDEALSIYESFTSGSPHPQYRSFDEAWTRFGEEGPLIEFAYLLTNNQTLKQRLKAQIDNLLMEEHPDTWFLLLNLVCFAGQIGCPLILENVKKEIRINNMFSAIQRLSNEYLIKTSEDGVYLEALHPQRALIITSILKEITDEDTSTQLLSTLKCIDSEYYQLLLMDYFSKESYSPRVVSEISVLKEKDWVACAGLIKTMLWLDVKRYVEQNIETIDGLIKKYGNGWISLMPIDVSGLIQPGEITIERFISVLPNIREDDIKAEVERVKQSLTSLEIDYEATDLLISNGEFPISIPDGDNRWSTFGYSLFWLAKLDCKIELSFSKEQMNENMLIGDIKSKAQAIRGLFEQNYIQFCDKARDILSSRIIEDYCVLNLEVTEDYVKCFFFPPVYNEEQLDSHPKFNFNHYWKMRVLELLDNMYPEKEYINVRLVGVDVFQDIGIEAMDHEVNIQKKNRPSMWITEINSWEKSRIDYSYRPDSWKEYLKEVDDIRQIAWTLIVETIGYIEFLYKKNRHSKERWDKIIKKLSELKKLFNINILLPKAIVDPYCLYREGMDETRFENRIESMIQAGDTYTTSIDQYSGFRKSFVKTYTSLISFFDSFAEVILARIEGRGLEDLKSSRLTLINLFDSAKSLEIMQNEYISLFDKYRTIEADFEKQEIESLLTLLNMWSFVYKYQIKGEALAYNSRQLYRKSNTITEDAFETALKTIDEEAKIIDGVAYILVDFDASKTIEEEYTAVTLAFREAYKESSIYNSIRWTLETNSLEIVYVPIYKGIPLTSGFTVPLYRVLDFGQTTNFQPLFPVELPNKLYVSMGLDFEELHKWRLAAGYLANMKILVAQYNDVLETCESSIGLSQVGFTKFLETFFDQLSELTTKFLDNIASSLKILEPVVDSECGIAINEILPAFDEIQKLLDNIVLNLKPIEGLEEKIDTAVLNMLLIQPYIIKAVEYQSEEVL